MAMILVSGAISRISRMVWMPSCCGMRMSVMTASGFSSPTIFIPSWPLDASTSRCFPALSVRMMRRRIASSSSITRISAMPNAPLSCARLRRSAARADAQYLLQRARQIVLSIRLRQQADACANVFAELAGGHLRGDDDLHVWPAPHDHAGKRQAIHIARHDHVGEQHVDRRLGLKRGDR